MENFLRAESYLCVAQCSYLSLLHSKPEQIGK